MHSMRPNSPAAHGMSQLRQMVADYVVQKPKRRNFRIWNSHDQRGHVTTAIPDTAFSAVWFCSYTVHRTQYDRPS